MLLNSPYTELRRRKDELLNTGFDYKGKIYENTLSNVIIRKDGLFREYLAKMDDLMHELIESVKEIKIFANPALDKNERRII